MKLRKSSNDFILVLGVETIATVGRSTFYVWGILMFAGWWKQCIAKMFGFDMYDEHERNWLAKKWAPSFRLSISWSRVWRNVKKIQSCLGSRSGRRGAALWMEFLYASCFQFGMCYSRFRELQCQASLSASVSSYFANQWYSWSELPGNTRKVRWSSKGEGGFGWKYLECFSLVVLAWYRSYGRSSIPSWKNERVKNSPYLKRTNSRSISMKSTFLISLVDKCL